MSAADTSTFSSLDYGRRWRSPRSASRRPTSEPAVPASTVQRDPDSDEESEVAPNGLRSKRRLHEEYQITSSNDEEMRAGGNRGGAFISRALFQQLVAHVQERLNAEEGGEDGDGEGGLFAQLIQSGECSVSLPAMMGSRSDASANLHGSLCNPLVGENARGEVHV